MTHLLLQKEAVLQGSGNSCCRSRDNLASQNGIPEFEVELLEAIAKLETEALDNKSSCNRSKI